MDFILTQEPSGKQEKAAQKGQQGESSRRVTYPAVRFSCQSVSYHCIHKKRNREQKSDQAQSGVQDMLIQRIEIKFP